MPALPHHHRRIAHPHTRSLAFNLGLLLAVSAAGVVYVDSRRAVRLQAPVTPEGWRLSYSVPQDWRDYGTTLDLLGWEQRVYRVEEGGVRLQISRRMMPADTTPESLAQWAYAETWRGNAMPTGSGPTAEPTELGTWSAARLLWSHPSTRFTPSVRYGVLCAVGDEQNGVRETYTVELRDVGATREAFEALWNALKNGLAIK